MDLSFPNSCQVVNLLILILGNWGLQRLSVPTVVDTVMYFPDLVLKTVVTIGAENGITRYPFVVSDFRDCLRFRSYHIKGDQYQCLSIKAWSCWLNLAKDDCNFRLLSRDNQSVIVLASKFEFCLCFMLSSPPFYGCWFLGHSLTIVL